MFPFDILNPIVEKVLEYIPSPEKKAEALAKAQQAFIDHEDKIAAAISAQNQQQASIDLEEAKNPSLFISGWRPSLGWVCAASFAWVYVLQPVVSYIATLCNHPVTLPAIDFSQMSTVLMGMLGLAGLRTYEKKTDSESNR